MPNRFSFFEQKNVAMLPRRRYALCSAVPADRQIINGDGPGRCNDLPVRFTMAMATRAEMARCIIHAHPLFSSFGKESEEEAGHLCFGSRWDHSKHVVGMHSRCMALSCMLYTHTAYMHRYGRR